MIENVKVYEMTDMQDAGLYCGTYKKYNEGSLYGMWISLGEFTDAADFLEVCRTLHDDENDPELMFQDFQGFPKEFYGESMGEEEIQKILDYLALEDDEREMLDAYIECFGGDLEDFEDLLDKAQDRNCGQWNSFREFADQEADEQLSCLGDVPNFLTRYFDYEAFARDLKMDYCESDNGYIFRAY